MIQDFLSDLLYWAILKAFDIYKCVARVFLKLMLPFLKSYVDKDFAKYGWNNKGTGSLGIQVHNETEFYIRTILEKNFGVFEAHMDKVCTINDPKALALAAMRTRKTKQMVHPLTWIGSKFNLQTKNKAWQTAIHYDIGNTLYELMLGKTMQYTCGYWRNAKTLDEAQLAKMDLIAHKLKLEPGMRVLDLGCGFGSLACHLAKNYGVEVVGCSISEEQLKYGRNLCQGLPVDLRLCDYRDMNEKFDRIVSCGMLEHVGSKNYGVFFDVAKRCLTGDGILMVHTMGNNHPTVCGFDVWSHKYLWPNGYIPYFTEVTNALDGRFIIEDWQNISFNYSLTIAAWEANFDKAWPDQLSKIYDERFYKTWKLYLAFAEAFFSTRSFQLWHIVLSKDGLPGGYEAVIQ